MYSLSYSTSYVAQGQGNEAQNLMQEYDEIDAETGEMPRKSTQEDQEFISVYSWINLIVLGLVVIFLAGLVISIIVTELGR